MEEKKKKTKKPPVVKDEEEFELEEDKRVVVFIAVAILVIIGTILGLLVGCERDELDEPINPNDGVELEPMEDEDIHQDEIVVEEEKKTVVKKVTNKTEEKEDEEETVTEKYSVAFYLLKDNGTDTYVDEVAEGGKVTKYQPDGYSDCSYFADSELTEEYNFDTKVTSAQNIYMVCVLDTYTIVYDYETTNPEEYTIEDEDTTLVDASQENMIFDGWYTDSEYTNEIKKIDSSIIDLADENKVVYVYAKFVENYEVTYYNYEDVVDSNSLVGVNEYQSYTVLDGEGVCAAETSFLGWTNESGNNRIKFNAGDVIELTGDIEFYPVCGAAKVVYASEGEVVEEVGYTEDELVDYELPTPDEVGIEAPTYFVPVEVETETSKNVVSDDKEDLAENEIKLQDVKDKASSTYTPEVGDMIEELEKVFDGWTTEVEDPENPGEMIEVEVPEDFVPEDEVTELEAQWRERTPEDDMVPEDNVEDEVNNEVDTLDVEPEVTEPVVEPVDDTVVSETVVVEG